MKKQTKIVATIGPASAKKETLVNMINAGMNCCRLNFSHGTYANHSKMIKAIRSAAKSTEQPIAIIQDLQGPRIRIGDIGKTEKKIKKGQKLILTCGTDSKAKNKIPITYKDLCRDVKIGDRVLLNDGLLELKIEKIKGDDMETTAISDGVIKTHGGVNMPDSELNISAISTKDIKDVEFGIKNLVDFVAISFVTSAKDIFDLRFMISDMEKKLKVSRSVPVKIIAKIEKHEAIDNMEEIVDAADGIMVARGDLGIEIAAEDVPIEQKNMIDIALQKAKPVIVATQMLDSMIHNPKPTRAEVSDVANAVIDHADAVMLSGETALGKFPVESVETMAKIIMKTEESVYDDYVLQTYVKKIKEVGRALGRISNFLAESLDACAIVAASLSGYTGRIVCRYRPNLPIFVATNDEIVKRQLTLSWGIRPFMVPTSNTLEELVARSMNNLKTSKAIEKGAKVIIIAGEPVGISGNINLVEVREMN